jgi:hypothetical protein
MQWFCQQGEGFCMHVFSSLIDVLVATESGDFEIAWSAVKDFVIVRVKPC